MIWTIGLAISANKFWKKCVYVICEIFVVLASLEYSFKPISLVIKLTKLESIIFADILTNFAEISSGPWALFTLIHLIVSLMALVLGYDRSNLFSGTHKFLIFRMLRWLLYAGKISLTVISSWDVPEEFPIDKGFHGSYLRRIWRIS